MLKVDLLLDWTDNYIFMLHCQESGAVGVVDPCSARPVLNYLRHHELELHFILNTHHHDDHVGGNLELKQAYSCEIYASKSDRKRIPGIDHLLSDGDEFCFGLHQATVLETPGHTVGGISFWFAGANLLFCGDTLFSLGCGRLFEGSPLMMNQSLQKSQLCHRRLRSIVPMSTPKTMRSLRLVSTPVMSN